MAEALKSVKAVRRPDTGSVHAAKRQAGMRELQRREVDPDRSGTGLRDDLVGKTAVALEDIERQGLGAGVDPRDDLVQVLIGQDRQHRPEDLFLVDVHFRRGRFDQRRGQGGSTARTAKDHLRALGRCVVQQTAESRACPSFTMRVRSGDTPSAP